MSQRSSNHLSPLAYFRELDLFTRVFLVGLLGVSIGLAGAVGGFLVLRSRVHHVAIAVGDKDDEAYVLAQAVEKVVEVNYPNIRIDLQTTGGTAENVRLLERGRVQLAIVQADDAVGSTSRSVAVLYEDAFQLTVKLGSKIRKFADLKGKRIGLPDKSGQRLSFLRVAHHFELTERDFKLLGTSDEEVTRAFAANLLDATFQVRALGNRTTSDRIQKYGGQLIAIDQAAAMKLKYPAFNEAVIPRGTYRGGPPVPAIDLPTVSVKRILLASASVDKTAIEAITSTLDERRQELARAIPDARAEVRPLVATIARPTSDSGVGVPLHAGALAYYDRDKPSFIQENADYVALILTVVVLFGSWVVEAKAWLERRRKNAADLYVEVTLDLMNDDEGDPIAGQRELDRIFRKAAKSLIREDISQESFRTFNEAYKTAREALDRRRMARELSAREALKENADRYVKGAIRLLQARGRHSRDLVVELDGLLEQAAADLVRERITEESFRTFVDAYKPIRSAIEDRERPEA